MIDTSNYKTIDLAREAKVHPNTVRLYEKIGFISPAPRAQNGYRVYDERHLYQIKICRCIFDYDWLGKGIRAASLNIIKAAVSWDLDKALEHTNEYLELIQKDNDAAIETSNILKRWTEKSTAPQTGRTYTRKEAARLIGVTEEALRNWDRNNLLQVPRVGANNARIYGDQEIERLRVIYMLRQSNYSISAILKSLSQYDNGNMGEVLHVLNTPDEQDGRSWIGVGDRWLEGLASAREGGRKILSLIEEIKVKNI